MFIKSELTKKKIKPISKCLRKKHVTPFQVALRLSCNNMFRIWGKGILSYAHFDTFKCSYLHWYWVSLKIRVSTDAEFLIYTYMNKTKNKQRNNLHDVRLTGLLLFKTILKK